MTHALLTALLATCAFVALACVSGLIGAEASGRAHGVAAWLLRRAVRRLPKADRTFALQDLMGELESDELKDRPISKIAFAMRVLVRAWATARAMGRPSLRTRAGVALSRLGGADAALPYLLPRERTLFALRGVAILASGYMTGSAFASAASTWMGWPLSAALPLGALTAATTVGMHTVGLSMRRLSSRFAIAARIAPRLLVEVALSCFAAQIMLLGVFRREIAVQAAHEGHRHASGVLDATALFHDFATAQPNLLVFQVFLTGMLVAYFTGPTLLMLTPHLREPYRRTAAWRRAASPRDALQ